ncbi:TBC1D13, partial [Symbiodinium microadriaticum]
GIEPSFYSLRWITTLLSREFDLLDTIRLWDSLLADNARDEFLCYICTTMVLEQKSALMMGDFGENLSL